MEATTLFGKMCWFTEGIANSVNDVRHITNGDARIVPYIYTAKDIAYCVSDSGRFFTIKRIKDAGRYVIMENEWHKKTRNGVKRNPYVMVTAGKNKRACLDVVKCVYCAFVAGRWVDERMHLTYKDGDNQNPSLSNIEWKRNNSKSAGLMAYSEKSWSHNYDRFVKFLMFDVGLTHEDAEDCVQTAFIEAFVDSCPYKTFLKSKNQEDEKYKREVLWRRWAWQHAVMLKKKLIKLVNIDEVMDRSDTLSDILEEGASLLGMVSGRSQRRILELLLQGYSENEISDIMGYKHSQSLNGMICKIVHTIRAKVFSDNPDTASSNSIILKFNPNTNDNNINVAANANIGTHRSNIPYLRPTP